MDNNPEQLSCLMDGEIETRNAKFLVRRLALDAGMKQTWNRYHLVRSVILRKSAGPIDLAGRVGQALAAETSPQSGKLPGSRWVRTAAGGALAASVALVAVFGINQNLLDMRSGEEARVDEPGFVSQTTTLDRQFSAQPVPVSFTPASERSGQMDRQRINSYLVRHNQAAGGTGFVSYTPLLTARPPAPVQPAEVTEQPSGTEAQPEERTESQPR